MSRCFSAGTGEKMQYLAHRFNDHTIRFVLRYPGRIDAERLGRAVLVPSKNRWQAWRVCRCFMA